MATPLNSQDNEVVPNEELQPRAFLGASGHPQQPELPDDATLPDDIESAEYNAEEFSPVEKEPSRLSRIQTQLGFFSSKLHNQRNTLVVDFVKNYVTIAFLLLGIFSIYWGVAYQRFSRLKNLEMLVVIDDDVAPAGLQTFGGHLVELLETPEAKYWGKWNVYNFTTYNARAAKGNRTIEEQIIVDIHHQRYWSSIYVMQNATGNWYEALKTADASYTTKNHTIVSIYETGRDFINMDSFITPSVMQIAAMWMDVVNQVSDPIVNSLSEQEKAALASSTETLALVNTPITFEFIDRIPFTNAVLAAPSQVGMLLLIIVSFFNLNFFQNINQQISTYGLKTSHFIAYRLASSAVSYFWLSLMYSFVSLAMQIDFTVAFGKAGFLVYWMTSFMTMWVVGSMSEVMVCWISLFNPKLLGFWLIFWVFVNISTAFTPLALSPKFYRFGYAMPLHNCAEILKVIFFNTWKGLLGRSYGVLVAWLVLANTLLGVTLYVFKLKVERKKKAEAEAAKHEEPEHEAKKRNILKQMFRM